MLQISRYRRTTPIFWTWHIWKLSSKTLNKRGNICTARYQDIEEKKADFLDITSLNTFMKNIKILQKYMAIPDYKKDEKVMLQNINI